jgi:protein-tyrosine phosphatase
MTSSLSVLFVCTGNICRSPTAQGIFERLLEQANLHAHVHVDSAGTDSYHVGDSPDARAQATAKAHGIDLSRQQARRITPEDCDTFDYLIVMDDGHRWTLNMHLGRHYDAKISKLLDYAHDETYKNADVPDPYYGGAGGFERVYAMIEDGCQGLLEDVKTHLAEQA